MDFVTLSEKWGGWVVSACQKSGRGDDVLDFLTCNPLILIYISNDEIGSFVLVFIRNCKKIPVFLSLSITQYAHIISCESYGLFSFNDCAHNNGELSSNQWHLQIIKCKSYYIRNTMHHILTTSAGNSKLLSTIYWL